MFLVHQWPLLVLLLVALQLVVLHLLALLQVPMLVLHSPVQVMPSPLRVLMLHGPVLVMPSPLLVLVLLVLGQCPA